MICGSALASARSGAWLCEDERLSRCGSATLWARRSGWSRSMSRLARPSLRVPARIRVSRGRAAGADRRSAGRHGASRRSGSSRCSRSDRSSNDLLSHSNAWSRSPSPSKTMATSNAAAVAMAKTTGQIGEDLPCGRGVSAARERVAEQGGRFGATRPAAARSAESPGETCSSSRRTSP